MAFDFASDFFTFLGGCQLQCVTFATIGGTSGRYGVALYQPVGLDIIY